MCGIDSFCDFTSIGEVSGLNSTYRKSYGQIKRTPQIAKHELKQTKLLQKTTTNAQQRPTNNTQKRHGDPPCGWTIPQARITKKSNPLEQHVKEISLYWERLHPPAKLLSQNTRNDRPGADPTEKSPPAPIFPFLGKCQGHFFLVNPEKESN